jgi:3-hydroxyisobutyrate dehydrogenase-like beta-hydroxyacid dehydrogenase
MLDSPITGGVQRAHNADITVITSGPRAAYEQAEPLLQSFAREIHYVGEQVGQAQLVKICNNIMSFTNLIVGLEALTMAAKGGVDPEKALAVINAGSGQNSATLTKIPHFILNRRFAEMQAYRKYKATFSPRRCHRPPPPAAAAARRAGGSPSTLRLLAKAARRQAWRGFARSGHAGQDGLR